MQRSMPPRFIPIVLFLLLAGTAAPQGPGNDFRLTKISRDLISSPDFSYSGAEQQRTTHPRWLRVDVQFSAAPEFTDELTFKYYILIAGKVLRGTVTHVNILAGRELHSSIYVPPHVLVYLLRRQPASINAVENIAVQILEKGELRDELSLNRASPDWFESLPAMKGAGLVLNKDETPFAPLFWDRYEQIKTADH
jgi:hypothetical protein